MSTYQSLLQEEVELVKQATEILERLTQIEKEVQIQFKTMDKYESGYSNTRCVGCTNMFTKLQIPRYNNGGYVNYKMESVLPCGHSICVSCSGYFRHKCLKCNSDTIPKEPFDWRKRYYDDKIKGETESESESESEPETKIVVEQAKKKQRL